MLRPGLIVPFLLFSSLPWGASAQPPVAAPSTTENVSTTKPADRRLYVGMWTIHFRDLDRGLDNNWMLGMSWGRIYGATFVNSFGRRAYSVGVQRIVAEWDARIVTAGLGYRVGLLTGYDGRLFHLAGETPVLPLLQPLITFDTNRFGLELSYAGVIASAGLNVRL